MFLVGNVSSDLGKRTKLDYKISIVMLQYVKFKIGRGYLYFVCNWDEYLKRNS